MSPIEVRSSRAVPASPPAGAGRRLVFGLPGVDVSNRIVVGRSPGGVALRRCEERPSRRVPASSSWLPPLAAVPIDPATAAARLRSSRVAPDRIQSENPGGGAYPARNDAVCALETFPDASTARAFTE